MKNIIFFILVFIFISFAQNAPDSLATAAENSEPAVLETPVDEPQTTVADEAPKEPENNTDEFQVISVGETVQKEAEPAPAVDATPVPAEEKDEIKEETPVESVVLAQPLVLANTSDSIEVKENSKQKRGIFSTTLPIDPEEAIAKGHFYAGLSLFLLHIAAEDDPLDILIGDLYEAEGYTFSLEAFGGYFIRDAMALGFRAGYERTYLDLDYALLEDLLDLDERRHYLSNGFFVQPILKNYLKLFNSSVYFFNETSIKFSYSYGISQGDDDEVMNRSRNRSISIDFGINPGVSFMILPRFAFETSVGLLGLSSDINFYEDNGETKSKLTFNMVNFTINLLALNLAIVTFF